MLDELTIDLVRAAHRRIQPYVLRTPTIIKDDLYLKPESLQSIGAFKIRGAFSLMTTLPAGCPGVVAHSSGNHAQAVARAAKVLGIPAVIVMPSDAPPLKRARTEADGAEVVIVGPDSDERARRAEEIAAARGLVEVPPFDHPLIAAGQGTAALELLEDVPDLDRFYAPVSGGGLMAGCAVVVKALRPNAEIIGVEPEDGADVFLSLKSGTRQRVPPPKTIADGLRVRIPGKKTWPVLRAHVDRVELVTDRELLGAMAYGMTHLRLVLEPSGAASLAVALRERRPGRSGVLLSGGNADPHKLIEALSLE